VRFIIVGSNVGPDLRALASRRAAAFKVPLLEFKVGKRTYDPFFRTERRTLKWSGEDFATLVDICEECGEPSSLVDSRCEWCAVSDEDRDSAPRRSMLVATLHYGIDKGLPFAFDGLRPKGKLTKPDGRRPTG